MNDQSSYRDHRMASAQATGDRDAAYRGWDFSRAVDEGPLWIRAIEECFRVRSLFIFAVIGAVAACWWL
jgi:hypothetical protein